MTKNQAIRIFGRTLTDLADALGITKSAVSQWPDQLTVRQTDWVIGAAVRMGKDVPSDMERDSAA